MNDITAELAVGHSAVQEMIQSLGYQKVCAYWVPCLLTEDDKLQRRTIWVGNSSTSSLLPELAPSDYHLFGSVKEQMRDQCYETLGDFNKQCINVYGQLEQSSIARVFSNLQDDGEKCVQKLETMMKSDKKVYRLR